MKDETLIRIIGMSLVFGFGIVCLATGHNGYIAGSIIFILGTSIGIVMPQPAFLRKD